MYCRTIVEMWDHEPEGRITASCASLRLEEIEQRYINLNSAPLSDPSSSSSSLPTLSIRNEFENVRCLNSTDCQSCVMSSFTNKKNGDEAVALITLNS